MYWHSGAHHDLALLVHLATILSWIQYANVCACCLAIYDYMITFSKEVDLIWRRRLSLGKILFLFIRYQKIIAIGFQLYGLLKTHHSPQFCERFIRWQVYIALSTFALTETVLQLRVYALYNQSKTVLILTTVIFVSSFIAGSVLLGHNLVRTTPHATGCDLQRGTNAHFVYWILVLLSESVLFLLVLAKGSRTLFGSFVKCKELNLLDVVVRDSILYYFVTLIVYLTIAVLWAVNLSLAELPAGFSCAIPSIMSERLMFRIQETLPSSTAQYSSSDSSPTWFHEFASVELSGQYLPQDCVA